MQTQDQQPDFIPYQQGGSSSPDFIPYQGSAPTDQHGAFVRFLSRASGVPEDVFSSPNKWLNPFSAAYNSPQHKQEQQALNPSIDQMQGPTMPGSQTVQDIKAKNYAGAAGDVLPGLLAVLQARLGMSSTPQPEVLPPSIAARPRIIPSRTLPAAPAEPIQLGSSSLDAPTPGRATREGLLPAKSQMVGDGQGGLKKQFLTSADTKTPSTPYTIDQAKMIQSVRGELERIGGTSIEDQQAVDQRMADYAKTPWENETPPDIPTNETPLQRYLRQRAALQPAQRQGEINVYPDANARGVITVGGTPVTRSPQRTMSSMLQKSLAKPSVVDQPQVVGNGDLTDVLTRSIAKAKAARAAR